MKKVVSLFLTLVLAMSLAVPAFAASEATFSLNAKTATVEAGDSLSLELKVDKAMKDVESFEFWIYYNAEGFELTSGEAGKCCGAAKVAHSSKSFSDAKGAYYKVTAADFTNGLFDIKAGTIYTLTFKAKDTVTAGTATFTLSNEGVYGKLNATRDVTTGSPVSVTTAAKTVNVTSITLSSTTMNLEVGQTGTLTATVTPDNATNKTVTWTTSNDKVATVANGVVTAVGKGTATITATAGGKTATCTVTVKVPACNHSEDKLTHVDGKAATCTENGVKEHYLCKCGTKLDLDKKTVLATTVIPATGHKTEKEENKATCAKLAVCDVCGESYGSLKKHTVVKVDKVDPTCNTPGVKAHYECSVCGKWFSDKNGTKEIAEADKASYVIPADPDMHVYDIVKDSYKEYDEGYYVEQFQCTKCGDSYWLASVDLRNVDVKLVQDGKGDLKNAKVEVASTSVKTKEVMSLYYNDTANAGDTLSLPVFFNYSKSATEAEAIAALKKDIAENSTFTVKAAATKSGWKFTTDKTYTVTVELDDAGKVVTKWVGSDNTEVSAEDTPTFTITGKKTTGGGGNGGSGNGGSTTTDTTKNDGKKVESGKTFDAGIAMYVGLSVLSVTGGALVIGKKKRF